MLPSAPNSILHLCRLLLLQAACSLKKKSKRGEKTEREGEGERVRVPRELGGLVCS